MQAAKDSDDPRLKALQTTQAALNGVQAYQAGQQAALAGQQGTGDLTLKGAGLQAGHDVRLKTAARDIHLLSVDNNRELSGDSHNSGGSLGVSVGSNGDSIRAEVGRNLTLKSEQDSDDYHSQQSNVSGGVSAGAGGSAQLNASHGGMESTYHSVTDQTGLYAGQGGFRLRSAATPSSTAR